MGRTSFKFIGLLVSSGGLDLRFNLSYRWFTFVVVPLVKSKLLSKDKFCRLSILSPKLPPFPDLPISIKVFDVILMKLMLLNCNVL